jgi:sugar phosphate isomerase/epimerase
LLKHLKNIIDLAIRCGVENLVFGCPRNRKLLDLNKDNDEIFIEFMSVLGKYIGTRKLIISIENNSKKYNCNYLNTIEQVGEIVKKINNPNIKMMVDIGNCIMENDNIENIIKYKNLINHIHISMPFMKPLIKYNEIEYTNFINILKKINYNNVISLEFLNNNDNEELKLLDETLNSFVNLILNK